jgi:hypothetical protein
VSTLATRHLVPGAVVIRVGMESGDLPHHEVTASCGEVNDLIGWPFVATFPASSQPSRKWAGSKSTSTSLPTSPSPKPAISRGGVASRVLPYPDQSQFETSKKRSCSRSLLLELRNRAKILLDVSESLRHLRIVGDPAKRFL